MLLARPNWAVYSRLVGEGDNLVKPLWNQVSKVNNAMMLSCERTWLKGKLGDFFYWLKVFIGPKLRQVSIGNFHRNAPNW